jgi:hypothetical protein
MLRVTSSALSGWPSAPDFHVLSEPRNRLRQAMKDSPRCERTLVMGGLTLVTDMRSHPGLDAVVVLADAMKHRRGCASAWRSCERRAR